MPVIVGAARSGTTLLRLMLDAHPQLAIPPETGFLCSAAAFFPRSASQQRRWLLNRMIHCPVAAPGWRDFGLCARSIEQRLHYIEPFSMDAGLRCFYRMYAERFDKPRYGDKTPRYGLFMRALQQVLPEAHFIHIIRDGRDVALSMQRVWFAPARDMGSLARIWCKRVQAIRAEGARSRNYMEIRYEDLIAEPEHSLRKICRFVDMNFDPAMNDYHVGAPSRLLEHRERVRPDGSILVSHEQRLQQQRLVTRPPDPSRVQAWRTQMSSLEQQAFEKAAQPLLRQLGY